MDTLSSASQSSATSQTSGKSASLGTERLLFLIDDLQNFEKVITEDTQFILDKYLKRHLAAESKHIVANQTKNLIGSLLKRKDQATMQATQLLSTKATQRTIESLRSIFV